MSQRPDARPTPITPPYVPLIDPRTGQVDRAWYLFFLSLYAVAQSVVDSGDTGPNAASLIASVGDALQRVAQELQTQPAAVLEQVQPFLDGIAQKLDTLPPRDQLRPELGALAQQLQTQPRSELGTMAALQQSNVPWLTFDTTPEFTPPDVGTLAYGGGVTLGFQATANVVMRLGESEFVYVKASSAITKGQLCYHTGAVGSSGVITAAPSPLALVDPNQIVGVAAESIALNGFGLIQISGTLRGFNTTGASVGETWADGDALYYNPAFVGSMTKVKPSAPNQKSFIGEVINAGSGGSGSMSIRIVPGSMLGGTDSNVQITSVADKNLLQYDSALGYWKNVPSTTVGVTSFSAGSTGFTPSTATTGAVTLAGTLAVGSGGTGLTSGTSGGVPYFSGTTSMVSSALLAANALMVGGGAGAAPSTIATGTGVTTALGVNTGAAGAFVVNGGGLGTPSSGTVTNLTGTASININGTVGATTPTTGTFTTITASNNLSFSSTAQRITGDMSNATFANRLAFQTSTTNGNTTISVLPNGTATISLIAAFNNSDPTNGSYIGLLVTSAETRVQSARLGTGTFLPLKFYTNGVEQASVDTSGNFAIGTAALATTATNGFLYIPTCAGAPTGVPTAITGLAPMVIDSTNNKLYFYSGGAWRDAGP
jgi:hypothetical protein